MSIRGSHPYSLRFALSLICVAACMWFAGSATPARAATVGVNADITWGIPAASVSQEVSLIQQARVPWIRATIDLSGAEYYGPELNMSYLSSIDAAVQAARNAGLNVLLELDRTPYWASADPTKYVDSSGGLHWNPYWEYSTPQVYAQVVKDVVNHYKAMGVNDYEVWNEPNNPSDWPSGPSAADYVAMLKAAYPAIKAADPNATVIMGGLENNGQDPASSYLQAMYNAGAKGYYDVANFHLYPGGDPTQCTYGSNGLPTADSFCLLDELRSEMTANGDHAPVWITELGWSTCTQTYCVTPEQQANYITSAYDMLTESTYSYVQHTFIYQMRDLYWDTSNTSWDSSLGVMDRNFNPKPAYYALQALASGTGQPAATPPSVSLTSPTAGASIGASVVGRAVASDPVGIAKVTFAIDGKVMATVASAPYSATLSTKKLATGNHVVTATAVDSAGRTASSSLPVYKNVAGASAVQALVSLHVSQSGRRSKLLAAAGQVKLAKGAGRANRSRVLLVLQHRHHRAWQPFRMAKVSLHHGHYLRHLRLSHGVWRVWAAFNASRSASSVIKIP